MCITRATRGRPIHRHYLRTRVTGVRSAYARYQLPRLRRINEATDAQLHQRTARCHGSVGHVDWGT